MPLRRSAGGPSAPPCCAHNQRHLLQVVLGAGGDAALYCVGDLFHHAVEAEHPEWMVTWADAETMRSTRRRVITQVLVERALLVAAHIRGVGRLETAGDGVRWVPA